MHFPLNNSTETNIITFNTNEAIYPWLVSTVDYLIFYSLMLVVFSYLCDHF